MGRGLCHYEVFCGADEAYEPDDALAELCEDQVELTRIEREDDPERFRAPRWSAPPDRRRTFRMPVSPASDEIARAVNGAAVCYSIEADHARPADLSFLEAAMALAFAIAEDRGGVVVDRTSDIGYTAAEFGPQADDPEIRDTVSIDEVARGERVALRTRGMDKYAEANLCIDDFPRDDAELARRLLYDNLCAFSAFQASIEAGQTLQYRRGDDQAFLFFSPVEPGLLLVSDRHANDKRPIPGLARFIDRSLPMLREQLAKEAFESAAADVATALEGGDDATAMAAAEQCLARAPDSVWALSMAAEIANRLCRAHPDDSERRARRDELVGRLLGHDSTAWSARTAKAGALIEARARAIIDSDPRGALAQCDQAAALVPEAPGVQLLRAIALRRTGDDATAFAILGWLDGVRAGCVDARLDAETLAAFRYWRASRPKDNVGPPQGAAPPAGAAVPDVDEPATDPVEALSEIEQLRLRAVKVGGDGWEQARNAALVALMLEAPVNLDAVRNLRFGQLDLDSGHARFGDGFLELELDTTQKLQYWFSIYRAEPAVATHRGPQYVFCGDDLSPLAPEAIDEILAGAGARSGVERMSAERVATTLEVQTSFDDDDD